MIASLLASRSLGPILAKTVAKDGSHMEAKIWRISNAFFYLIIIIMMEHLYNIVVLVGDKTLGSELYVLAHTLELSEDLCEEAWLRVDPQHGSTEYRMIIILHTSNK